MQIFTKHFTLTFFCAILFLGAHHVQARAQPLERKISITFKNDDLTACLEKLEVKAQVHFFYDAAEVANIKKSFDKSFTDTSISEILSYLLTGSSLAPEAVNETKIIIRKVKTPVIKSTNQEQKGSIKGRVVDLETSEPLPGAYVVVSGTKWGTSTDAKGNFLISDVRPGSYAVEVSFIGYQKQKLKDIKVTPGNVTPLNILLQQEASNLNEVEVVGDNTRDKTVINSTELSMISEIKDANLIMTGISNEQIKKSIDRDASDIIKRGSSATIINDRFVLLRGLDPRYTLTMLNGFIAPTTETNTRDFSFDLIPSNVIDKITIYKSPVPELPADYVGGVVNISTKNTSIARQIQVQLSTQYRTGTTFDKVYTHEGSKTDWLGYDNSVRPLPKTFPSEYDLPKVVFGSSPTDTEYNSQFFWSETQKKSWKLQRKTAGLDKRLAINYYDSRKIGKTRLNYLTSVAYTATRQNQYIDGAYLQFGSLINYRRDSLSIESARVSLMQNFKWVINEKNSIDFNNFLNQIADDNTLVRYRNGAGGDYSSQAFAKSEELRYRSRFLYSGQVIGNHAIKKSNVTWRFAYTRSNEKLPNYRGIAHARSLDNDSIVFGGGFNEYFDQPFAIWQDLSEKNYTGAVDFTFPLHPKIGIKTGIYGEVKNREFITRRFNISIVDNAYSAGSLFYNPDSKLQTENFLARNEVVLNNGKNRYGMGDITSSLYYLGESGSPQPPDYRAANNQYAAYIALNASLLKDKLTLYGGVRMEYNNQQLYSPRPKSIEGRTYRTEKKDRDSTGVNFLPSINATYHLNQKMQLRAGYGYTLNRPVFREIAPYSFYEMTTNSVRSGNLVLYQARAQNTDLRWEWYPSQKSLVSVGLYYKYIVDPIELYAGTDNGSSNIYINSRYAKTYGVEVELRKDLGFISEAKFFKDLSVISNVSIIKTEVHAARNVLGDVNALVGGKFVPVAKETRPLVGTSPYIINAGLYYDNEKTGTQFSVLYNRAGQRLIIAGSEYSVGELYELPRDIVDLVYTQRVTSFLSVKLGVQDILNQAFRFYRDVNRNERYDNAGYDLTQLAIEAGEELGPIDLYPVLLDIPDVETLDYMETAYKPGSYYSFGLNFKF